MAELLLEHGADIDLKDRYGNTPLDLAREKGHKKVVLLLERDRLLDPEEWARKSDEEKDRRNMVEEARVYRANLERGKARSKAKEKAKKEAADAAEEAAKAKAEAKEAAKAAEKAKAKRPPRRRPRSRLPSTLRRLECSRSRQSPV